MTLKFYTLFTLLFIIVLGNFVYFFVTKESAPLDILGIHLTAYPIALWVTLPFVLFYLLNVVLMSVSTVQNYFRLRNYERDFEKLKDAFYNAYLQKERTYEYKTPRYRLLGDLVQSSVMRPKKGAVIEDDAKIQSVFDALQELDAGKPVDMKRFSLSKSNPLSIKNAKNRLKSDAMSAEKMLNSAENYDDATIKEAYGTFAATATLSDLLKYKKFVSIRSLLTILYRVNQEENAIEIALEELLELTRNVTREINPVGFMELAIAVRTVLIPEDRMRYFKTLLDEGFEVNEALLYTYLDLEMVDKARELLENFTEEDFPKYRAFLALKDISYSCNIDLLVQPEFCKK